MSNAVPHFCNDLFRLIDRFRLEYEMSYAELVGCLEMQKDKIICEAYQDEDDEDEDQEDESGPQEG